MGLTKAIKKKVKKRFRPDPRDVSRKPRTAQEKAIERDMHRVRRGGAAGSEWMNGTGKPR